MGLLNRKKINALLPTSAALKLDVLSQEIKSKNNRRAAEKDVVGALGAWFTEQTGEPLNLDDPITFNQKTQWLKIYDSTELKGRLADKYLVRSFIEETIGADYLVPLLGAYDSPEDIDFDALPNRFVLKATHGSGWNIVVQDKSRLNIPLTKWRLRKWLEMDFSYLHGFEFHYQHCHPRIIAEEYLDDLSSGAVDDYKVYCFNAGDPIVLVCRDRFSDEGIRTVYYDQNWEKLAMQDVGEDTFNCEEPPHLKQMIDMSGRLASGFAFVRVDWYESTRGLLFGEMTFTSASGTEDFDPPIWNRILGDRIDLSRADQSFEPEMNI